MSSTYKPNGFLLIEVMVAASIIATACIALSGVFILCTKANAEAQQYTIAVNLAQKHLEVCKVGGRELKNEEYQVELNRVQYTITTTVGPCPEADELVQAEVRVTWLNHQMHVTTLFPNSSFPSGGIRRHGTTYL